MRDPGSLCGEGWQAGRGRAGTELCFDSRHCARKAIGSLGIAASISLTAEASASSSLCSCRYWLISGRSSAVPETWTGGLGA